MNTSYRKSGLSSLIIGLVLASATGVSSAVETRTLDGIIESVDRNNKSLRVISTETGEARDYRFEGRPRVDVNGYKFSRIDRLEPGQSVLLKIKNVAAKKDGIAGKVMKGEILHLDLEASTVLIAPEAGGEPKKVELPEGVIVSGLHSGASYTDLKEGQRVTLKFSSR